MPVILTAFLMLIGAIILFLKKDEWLLKSKDEKPLNGKPDKIIANA